MDYRPLIELYQNVNVVIEAIEYKGYNPLIELYQNVNEDEVWDILNKVTTFNRTILECKSVKASNIKELNGPLIELYQNVNARQGKNKKWRGLPLIELYQNVNRCKLYLCCPTSSPLIELYQNVNADGWTLEEMNSKAFNRTILECKYD